MQRKHNKERKKSKGAGWIESNSTSWKKETARRVEKQKVVLEVGLSSLKFGKEGELVKHLARADCHVAFLLFAKLKNVRSKTDKKKFI